MSRYFIFIPNFLSIVRIGLVYPILNNINNADYLEGLIFFAIASITDALDGFLARRMSWQTDLGKILDPVADKLLLSGSMSSPSTRRISRSPNIHDLRSFKDDSAESLLVLGSELSRFFVP